MKKIRYFLEYLLVLIFYYLFRAMGIDRASASGGAIAKKIGPWLKVNATARRNIEKAMPELVREQVDGIIEKMWENIGRFVGEFPHMEKLAGKKFLERVELIGAENVEVMKKSNNGAILFSGHFANWEILPKMACENSLPLTLVYRPANNKMVNDFIIKARSKNHKAMFIKGSDAARGVVGELKKSGYVAMLLDQKMNEGIRLKFFGRDAMTAPALAQFALNFGCPVIPALVRRKQGAYFQVEVFPPLEIIQTGNKEEDIKNAMQKVNDLFESWVREKPEEWFWLHKRWVD